ncbi:MAG: L,D-transpeptidase family protein, partial [Xanthobacteraceae bacterium]
MTHRFTTAIVTLAAALLTMTAAPPADAAAKQASPAHPVETTAPRDAGDPIMAIVSIKSQQVTIYDADGWIFRAPVSTGIKGRETPAGVFSVVEKDKDHHSNLYDDAWMPNMERITWSGIALHGGPLPGYAASHGCIRMPYSFAETLFGKTQIGMRVIIAPNDAEPVEFSDPKLFVPNAQAVAAAPARAETLAREAADAAKTADDAKTAATVTAREAAAAPAAVRKLELLKVRADAELPFAEKV